MPPRERVRWLRARAARRVETLPPFWIAFALTLTGTVGTTTLALPIAVAAIGPAAGIGVVLGLAAVMILTIAAMSEAVTRSGGMRYGTSYLGRLVAELLGGPATWIFTLAALFALVFALLVRFLGLASVLETGTPVPAVAWAALLFLVNLHFLRRGTFSSTLASTLVVGAVNVALLVLLSLLALPHVEAAHLSYVNDAGTSGPFELSALGLVFGVSLGVYARHISVGSAAKLVLPRDPSGRSLLRGSVAGLGGAALLSCVWVLAVNGALAPSALREVRGTALTPLADVAGPPVSVAGGLFALLAMGMGSIAISLALFYHVREWVPANASARAQRLSGIAPVVALFVLVEWLLATDRASFTGAIAFVNAITGPVLSGIFPILLLAASRRRGEYVPGTTWRFLGRRPVAVVLYAFFVGVVLAHGFVFWEDAVQRAVAVLSGLVTLAATVLAGRRGSFRRQLVIELRAERGGGRDVTFNVTSAGRPAQAGVRVESGNGSEEVAASSGDLPDAHELRTITFRVPQAGADTVKVWLHQVDADGTSEGLAGRVVVGAGGEPYAVGPTGQVVVPLDARDDGAVITVSELDLRHAGAS